MTIRRGRTERNHLGQQTVERWQHPTTDQEWKRLAACRGTNTEMWFPNRSGDRRYSPRARTLIKMAKLVCHECPVRIECLTYAVATDTRHGIWGGTTETERARITKRRPVG